MLALCQHSEEYNKWMLDRMAACLAPKPLGAARENGFRSGGFNVAVRELIAFYVNMEEFYVEENVDKVGFTLCKTRGGGGGGGLKRGFYSAGDNEIAGCTSPSYTITTAPTLCLLLLLPI